MPFPFVTPRFDPIANPGAVIQGPNFRFTMLTDRLVRLEYSPEGYFEDLTSQAFWFRNLPVPIYSLRTTEDKIEIETEYLLVNYSISKLGFTYQTLQIMVKSTGVIWRYGEPVSRSDNLKGTARTLDQASGQILLENGLMSRAGWSLVDDTRSLVFNPAGWLENRTLINNLDLYFFGFGHDYQACLRDFHCIAGQTPLIPRWALGNWWSRYWDYSDQELLDVMQDFQEHGTPLSVCIVDMDWHLTQTGNASTGWTGYTWNRDLFPDPQDFIQRLHGFGLKTALNLHPAEGIHPHESAYPEFAVQMGVDPKTKQPIPFDAADPTFMRAYFDLLHHPLEKQGIDFWWIDWQQGLHSRISGLDPLWWLNHLHFYDLMRDGSKRPFIFSRWGGLGNHRYPIGFSGDTVVGWEALDFQPYFTSTAANVGYSWWSHDIGGHMSGFEDDELFVRWVQYGVFSPIFRQHSTNSPFHERRPWKRGVKVTQPAISAMRLRHPLIPYLYSMAWRNTQASLPLITPLYYTHPEAEDAYHCPQAYWFGSELIAAPFTQPADSETHLSRQVIWLPKLSQSEPVWFDFFSGKPYKPGWHTLFADLGHIPVFARAGAIVPLAAESGDFGTAKPIELQLVIFPGADHSFQLYEDDGETLAYQDGHFAITQFNQTWAGQHMELKIAPVQGDISQIPAERTYLFRFMGMRQPDRIEASIDGLVAAINSKYHPTSNVLVIGPIHVNPGSTFTLSFTTDETTLLAVPHFSKEKLHAFLNSFHLESYLKQQIEQEWPEIMAGKRPLESYRALSPAQVSALTSLLET
jgi:alpha-glucosidase (family GH31 glycosyl hydrolase)